MCEITTDKATIGYESQEEGYIAKILSQDGLSKILQKLTYYNKMEIKFYLFLLTLIAVNAKLF